MTIEQIKEQLSNQYIGVLAVNRGFVMDKPSIDQGIDYTVRRTYTFTMPNGNTRYTTDSRYIDIQLKATTENQVTEELTQIKYDLEAKNYNDMIERMTSGIAPLILILFVLPDDRNLWVDIDTTELRVRRLAYWYRPPAGSAMTPNGTSKRITIPKTNVLGIDCFDTLHGQFYP